METKVCRQVLGDSPCHDFALKCNRRVVPSILSSYRTPRLRAVRGGIGWHPGKEGVEDVDVGRGTMIVAVAPPGARRASTPRRRAPSTTTVGHPGPRGWGLVRLVSRGRPPSVLTRHPGEEGVEDVDVDGVGG